MSATELPVLISASPSPYPYPGIPSRWSAAQQRFALQVLDDCVEAEPELAGHVDRPMPGADVEDFWESAARLSAAVQAARSAGMHCARHEAPHWAPDELARRLGPVATVEEDRHAHDVLLRNEVFLHHAGRRIEFCSIADDGTVASDDLFDDLGGFRDSGHAEVVVKAAGHKQGVFSVPVLGDREAQERAWYRSEAGDATAYTAWRSGSLVLQEKLDLAFEYRLFFVDGELITGAGNIEEFTPFDRESDSPFDERVRERRGHGIVADEDSPVVRDEALVERYLAFGRSLRDELLEHGVGTIVVDVALDLRANRVVVVELNAVPNTGLYASDVWALYEALVRAEDRGYRHQSLKRQFTAPSLRAIAPVEDEHREPVELLMARLLGGDKVE